MKHRQAAINRGRCVAGHSSRHLARLYFEDGSIEWACPPLKALLHIMAYDQYKGKGLDDPGVRELFSRESLLASDWYCEREKARKAVDTGLWLQHIHYLEQFLTRTNYAAEAERLHLKDRLVYAKEMLEKVKGASLE